tara:strand:- start:15 stop:800 length:786 start_codon:yes stop_codon:yes gene_type:complete
MDNREITSRFDANNYLFNKDSKYGIYIIHGFSSTTYEILKIAKHLSNYGYYVRADNLPGHGTTLEDCNLITYQDWLMFVEQKIAEMYTHCSKVIVIGVSMGSVIALHLGTVFPLSGIIASSTLLKFKNEFNVRVLTRLFHRIKKSISKKSNFQPDQLKALHEGFYGYRYYPLTALNEMRKMIDKIKPRFTKISSPVLLIHSKIDQTATFENYHILKKLLVKAKIEELILNKTGHNVFDTDKKDKDQIFTSTSNFIEQHFNE